MGDAGPLLPVVGEYGTQEREVTVLVTGFGPFKTFSNNPSHLITTRLPASLHPTDGSKTQPKIRLLIHPHPLRVSYPTIATTIPALLSEGPNPDYILHLGMAAGRRHYALETLAHRDGYTIKDVDYIDGLDVGSRRWALEGCPPVLEVGWDKADVLSRWRHELNRTTVDGAAKPAAAASTTTTTTFPDVRLSSNAGRYVCDFIFYETLSERWKADQRRRQQQQPQRQLSPDSSSSSPAIPTNPFPAANPNPTSQKGKVAFLHVPGDTDPSAIDRGVRVTEAAIRALVSSWEAGYRHQQDPQDPSQGDSRVGVEFVS